MRRAVKSEERSLSAEGLNELKLIGEGLDNERFPVVHVGGRVAPDYPLLPCDISGQRRTHHESEEPRGSAAGSREGPARWKRTSGRQATTTCPAPSVIRSGPLVEQSEQTVEAVADAYPQVGVRRTINAIWYSLIVKPIASLQEEALIVMLSPFDPLRRVNSWAWWFPGIWVGPRHTNYPDGSICSFEQTDGTWRRGDSLVTLLDLHCVWLVRHLHLRHFGRWPGHQVLHTAYERIAENGVEEFCGCDSGRPYAACCHHGDLAVPPHVRYREFIRRFRTAKRRPPTELLEWVFGRNTLEPIDACAPQAQASRA